MTHTWANDFNTSDEACEFYGAETSASLAGEAAYWDALYLNEAMDAMEARGGPEVSDPSFEDEIPF